jgi:transcriptional regulator with PAS, ATPase and Fis domain
MPHRPGALPVLAVQKAGRLNITAQQISTELARHHGNKSATARTLGISKVGLWVKMEKLGLL